MKTTLDRSISFISDISIVSYNIRLTKKGQLATFLYSRLAHKEATGNSAYFFEYKPHLTYSFKVACPSKEQVHEERVEVVLSSDQTFRRDVVQTFRQFFPQYADRVQSKLTLFVLGLGPEPA